MRQTIFLLCLWACSLLAGHAQEADEANYDESKIPPYTLPALLKRATLQALVPRSIPNKYFPISVYLHLIFPVCFTIFSPNFPV